MTYIICFILAAVLTSIAAVLMFRRHQKENGDKVPSSNPDVSNPGYRDSVKCAEIAPILEKVSHPVFGCPFIEKNGWKAFKVRDLYIIEDDKGKRWYGNTLSIFWDDDGNYLTHSPFDFSDLAERERRDIMKRMVANMRKDAGL